MDDYLDFMKLIKSTETGGEESFKELFYEKSGTQLKSMRISNAHTIINSILRNDDVVPKMMIMKYYLEILKPQYVKKEEYEAIHYINIVAILFSSNGKRKGSEQIGIRLIQEKWIESLKDLAYKMLEDMSLTTDFAKICKVNRKYTIDTGQHMARRYLTMCDSYSWNKYFEEEFLELARTMDNVETIYVFKTREKLMELGFTLDDDTLKYSIENGLNDVIAEINPKEKNITLSVEVYNPYYGINQTDIDSKHKYNEIIEMVKSIFFDKFKNCPEIHSSNEYGGSDDESITFSYDLKMHKNNVSKFIDAVIKANDLINT